MTGAQEAWEGRKEANAAFLQWITGSECLRPHIICCVLLLRPVTVNISIVVASEGIWSLC